jgi:hypothetical protein
VVGLIVVFSALFLEMATFTHDGLVPQGHVTEAPFFQGTSAFFAVHTFLPLG